MLSLLRGDRLIWDDIRYHAIVASAGSFLSVNTSDFGIAVVVAVPE